MRDQIHTRLADPQPVTAAEAGLVVMLVSGLVLIGYAAGRLTSWAQGSKASERVQRDPSLRERKDDRSPRNNNRPPRNPR